MKCEDLMNGISEIDTDLVEKFVETDRKLQNTRKSPNPKRLWLKIGGIAACAALIAAIPMGLMLSGRGNPSVITVDGSGYFFPDSFTGFGDPGVNPNTLTYEEIMRLPTLSGISLFDRDSYKSLKDYMKKRRKSNRLSFVCGDVLKVCHYLEWDGKNVRGFTVSIIRITDVDSSCNELGVYVGAVVQIRENYYIRYKDPERERAYLDELDPGIQELTLVRGEEYGKCFLNHELAELPMGVGNQYTFCMLKASGDDSNLYSAEGVYCVGMNDLDGFLSECEIRIEDDIRMVAKEINKRFAKR